MTDLSLKGIHKNFGAVEVIKGVDLEVEPGEFVVFVGPSGCGKSTLLRMIAGLESISSGELKIGGELCNDVHPGDRGIAMVFQSYALYPRMSVYDNIGFSLKVARAPKAERDRRIRNAARILQIEHLLDRRPSQLSGGQRQRVAIGRAIVREPKVFLFDEPLSNLDAALRVDMRMELALLHRQLGATMVYVTHDQVEAMTLADKIVVMSEGGVQQVGRPMELYQRPDNLFVAGFIGSPKMNLLSVRVRSVEKDCVEIEGDCLKPVRIPARADGLSAGDRMTLGIRPKQLNVSSARGAISVTVRGLERLGSETIVSGRLNDGTQILATLDGDLAFEFGSTAVFAFDPSAVALFDSAEQSRFLNPPNPEGAMDALEQSEMAPPIT
jgi:multiple sugar transport system ATP-binding protein